MDLSHIVALAEILGTIAVVVSLIYVAVQIRQNTHAMKLSTAQNLSHDYREVIAYLHSDPEFSAIYLNSMKDVESLTGEERFRVYVWTQNYFRTLENAYYQFKKGAVDEYVWESLVANMRFGKGTSSEAAFWRDRQHIFSKEFRNFYNDLASDDPQTASAPYEKQQD